MRLMALRYAGNCQSCGVRIEQRSQAWYDPSNKTVTCTTCRPVDDLLIADADRPVGPPAATSPTVPMRAARTDLEKGGELERRIAEVFASKGYRVQTNVVREGRSGATHEVDVLAEKTDELLTMSVAIECKAWANPIEKDVIAKFNEVRRDLGIGHALVVSLNGARSGAHTLARDLGVIVWGPDEIEPHFGKSSLVGLQNRPMVEEVGFPRLLDAEDARRLIEKQTAGRLGIGREEVVWSGEVWLPVAVVQLTLRKVGLFQRKAATSQAWSVYDLIGGTFVTRLDEEPERTPVQLDGPRLEALQKLVAPAKTMEKAIDKWANVTSDSATEKYRNEMSKLGIPDGHTATVGTSTPFVYPVHLAIARRNGTERVIAIDAYRRRPDDDLDMALSKHIAAVRQSISSRSAT
jgi:hypothetical protein